MKPIQLLNICVFGTVIIFSSALTQSSGWTRAETTAIESLSINKLSALPADASNLIADNPKAAVLGQKWFFDTQFSGNNEVSCATCHDPSKGFTDQLRFGEGVGTTKRNTPTIIGAAHNTWYFWDGRADSMWSQALGPLEAGAEHGTNRIHIAKIVIKDYLAAYQTIFGTINPSVVSEINYLPKIQGAFASAETQLLWRELPTNIKQEINTIFTNVGKGIESYERLLIPGQSRFDQYANEISTDPNSKNLTELEKTGLKLFIGKANCIECHSGPLMTDQQFYNTAVPMQVDLGNEDLGRASGLRDLLNSDFNCKGTFSETSNCKPLESVLTMLESEDNSNTLIGAFKTPTLRNITQTFPYMHAGQFQTLQQVLQHYLNAPKASVGQSAIQSKALNQADLTALEAFLKTLTSEINAPSEFLKNPFK